MRKTYKILDTKYRVEKDGKNCLYLKADNSDEFKYAELVFFGGKTKLRIMESGLDIWAIPRKLRRRLRGFLDRGYSIYATGQYRYMEDKDFNRSTR